MKKVIFSVAVVAAMVFTGCKSEKKEATVVEKTVEKTSIVEKKVVVERLKVDVKFQNQLEKVVASYLELKDEFVLSNAGKTTEIIAKLTTALSKVDMSLLKDPVAHKMWMESLMKIKSSAALMSATTEIKKQRVAFIGLSAAMIDSVKAFGINKTVYKQFCPMANKNKGAAWLSFQKDIKNPYFGDAMLTCGSVQDTMN
jgi:Cu(I)/Ag(I) efflux system membrane fusion protein